MADNVDMTVIGRDAHFKGEIIDAGRVNVFGVFEGKIASVGAVQVDSGAQCDATIEAERVVVDGAVHGDITASDVLTLDENARVEGDIVAGTLVVKDGASFIGNCRVGSNGEGVKKSKSSSGKKRIKLVPTQAPQAGQELETKPTRVSRVGSFEDESSELRLSPMDAAS
jgi:cytoskeletal protein CcmA (bactofilin family)